MPGSYPAEAVTGKPVVARGTSAHEPGSVAYRSAQSGGRTGQHSSQPLTNPPAGIPRVAAISACAGLKCRQAPLFDAPLPDLSSDISGPIDGREAKISADRDQRARLRLLGRFRHALRGAQYLAR